MPLPEDFAEQCFYDERAWFVHDLIELDADNRTLHALIDTTRLGTLVEAQVDFDGHPKHLPGAVCLQATGTLGVLMSAYALDMRRTDGWSGFGTHVHDARFPTLGEIGPPVHARAAVLSLRTFQGTRFVRFRFEFTQDERIVYRSEQTAAWRRSAVGPE
ncbi:MAG: hypothetical protein KTR31_18695 [Myxococcales bacterium]|nr:hypothetical protein [Myxococcales bacterium]